MYSKNLIPFDLFSQAFANVLDGDIRHISNHSERIYSPAVNVVESKDAYSITAELAGVKPEDVDIQIDNGYLTIKGEKKSELTSEEGSVIRSERTLGRFERSFNLPDHADLDKIEANYDHGVLTLTVPKKEEVKPRKINLKLNSN